MAALLLATGCAPSAPPGAGPADLERLLPPASMIEGWRVAEGPTSYGPDTLYEYIDGGAERYLTYGFRRLVHVRYETEGDARAGVTLDLFDMGGAPAAFGIYRSGLRETDAPEEWCTEAYRSGIVGAGWKGLVFVHVLADDEASGRGDLIERLLRHACDGIAGDASLPAILDPLPEEGRVPRSERYVPRDLLGHEFLPGGILAGYKIDGRLARMFVCDLGSTTAAASALAKLREHHARLGEVLADEPSIGASGFRFSESGRGEGLATVAGRHIAGIQGEPSREAQDRLLRRLVEKLGA
jgi:hypothetical protein